MRTPSNIRWLSTHSGALCPLCDREFLLSEPTDILAKRPIRVAVYCPDCGADGSVVLTDYHFLGDISLQSPPLDSQLPTERLIVECSGSLSPPRLPTVHLQIPSLSPANDSGSDPTNEPLGQASTQRTITLMPLSLEEALQSLPLVSGDQ